MEMTIDTPSKNLAGEIDRMVRVKSPEKKKKGFCEFIFTNWKMWVLILWLLTVFIVTEIFGMIDKDTKDRVYWEGTPKPYEKYNS